MEDVECCFFYLSVSVFWFNCFLQFLALNDKTYSFDAVGKKRPEDHSFNRFRAVGAKVFKLAFPVEDSLSDDVLQEHLGEHRPRLSE